MDNSRMFSATHGLNVTKTLLSAKTAPSRKTACGSSFAQTLVSVTTRKTTITVTKTTTEMTMAEYQEYIYEKISNLPVHPTQANRSASVFISAEGFAEMKANSEYEDWVIGKLEEDFAISNPLCPRCGSYVVYQFGAKKSDYHGDSWYPEFQGGQGDRVYRERSEGAFWSNRRKQMKELYKESEERYLHRKKEMQMENLHVRKMRLMAQGKYDEAASVIGAGLPASLLLSGLGGTGTGL